MFKHVKNHTITSLLVFVFVFTCVTASFVIIETAHADNNIVYKHIEITYYHCTTAEFGGTPIYSKCVTREDGMEDDDHPEDTKEEIWGPKPVYE
ncbi:MAG: hypothetical protein OXU23_00960 [Candidatus Poribacteria bacterium]|nr:hypothetical protein [Candidatus Poribacteria bacterium]